MKWEEVRQKYNNEWIIIEAINARTQEDIRLIDQITVVDAFNDDNNKALHKYVELHKAFPERELYAVHTSREQLNIKERRWIGVCMMKRRDILKRKLNFVKMMALILILTTLLGCTSKPVVKEQKNEKFDGEIATVDDIYIEGDYELLKDPDSNLEVGTKIYLYGHLNTSTIRIFDLEYEQYLEGLELGPKENVNLYFVDSISFSPSQVRNFSYERMDMIRGKTGKFYLEYLGNMGSGVPVCLLDKVDIEGKTYDRNYLGGISNVIGTSANPAKIGEYLNYVLYDYCLTLELVQVLKGDEAKRVVEGFDKSNAFLLKNKEIMMAKFEIYNEGEPIDLNYSFDFKYANESLTAKNTDLYLKNIKDEMKFTLFNEKDAEGWVIFEINPDDLEGYAVFKNELWFKLF